MDRPTELVGLWLASQNVKKREELARLLDGLVRVRTLAEIEGGSEFDVVEDAPDFAGNARKKALECAAFCRDHGAAETDLVLADDSGLCVAALGGAPGIYSARYAGPGASDRDRMDKLLSELEDAKSPDARSAHFACALALVSLASPEAPTDPHLLWQHEAHCAGRILHRACGDGGFGYDPVFAPSDAELEAGGYRSHMGQSLSFAQLDPAVKDRIGHRGKALQELRTRLLSL